MHLAVMEVMVEQGERTKPTGLLQQQYLPLRLALAGLVAVAEAEAEEKPPQGPMVGLELQGLLDLMVK